MARNANPQIPTEPRPGFYLVSLAREAWQVGAEIRFDGTLYSCSINGEEIPGSWTAKDLEGHWADWLTAESESPIVRIMVRGEPCTEDEYLFRIAMKDWALAHAPEHPAAKPTVPIDVRLLPASDDF